MEEWTVPDMMPPPPAQSFDAIGDLMTVESFCSSMNSVDTCKE
jgi:hypothetical protein